MLQRFIEYKVTPEGQASVQDQEPKYLKVSSLLLLGSELQLSRSCIVEIWI